MKKSTTELDLIKGTNETYLEEISIDVLSTYARAILQELCSNSSDLHVHVALHGVLSTLTNLHNQRHNQNFDQRKFNSYQKAVDGAAAEVAANKTQLNEYLELEYPAATVRALSHVSQFLIAELLKR